jgi:homoserine dehydrogenase
MTDYRLALVGFGNVGQGLAAILRDSAGEVTAATGSRFPIVAVNTATRGSVYDPDGLDAARLLDAVGAGHSLEHVAAPHRGWDVARVLAESNADVVVELSPTDLVTAEPATGTLRAALGGGRHAITTNKGPIALHYPELAALAAAQGRFLGFEGTVMAGTPVLRLGRELLAGAGISRIAGILNGTTNYMLTQMAAGADYAAALAEAQALGYAEADPTADVDGHDAAVKVVILANLLLGGSLRPSDVVTAGISSLTAADVAEAAAAGECWKLIGRVTQTPTGLEAAVGPVRLSLSHPLAGVGGATNAVTFSTALTGEVTLVGPGAGRVETGYAVLGDLLALHRQARGTTS